MFKALLISLFSLGTAHAAPSIITINIKEYGAGSIRPEVLEAIADGTDVPVAPSTGSMNITIPINTKLLNFRIGADPIFRERTVTLRAAGLPKNHRQIFTLERKRNNFTYEYLKLGLARLEQDKQPDAALAIFENAFRDPTRPSTVSNFYEANLRYNYARALQHVCLKLEFDTCDEAREEFDAILESFNKSQTERRIYESEKITQALVEKALLDLRSKDVRVKYIKFTTEIASKEYEKANKTIQAIEQADPLALKAEVITPSRIASDRAYLRSLRPNAID